MRAEGSAASVFAASAPVAEKIGQRFERVDQLSLAKSVAKASSLAMNVNDFALGNAGGSSSSSSSASPHASGAATFIPELP